MENLRLGDSISSNKKPLGELLVEAGLVAISQIELALQEQKQSNLRIGEILVSHGWIGQKTVTFFVERWLEVLEENPKKPSVYYFQEAGLLDTEQINSILKLQKLKHHNIRFHSLAVKQGYLKQITVDFFLAHIFNVYNSNAISVTQAYEVLKRHIRGEKEFFNIDLRKAPLMSVSLKGIFLNGSNLRKAELSMANLSNSSLVEVNLTKANLTKANLTEVNFTRSFLTRANLREAHLEKANFQSAILHEVDFQSAYLAQANFSGADLTKANLAVDYPYEVYYDKYTIFDPDFNPNLAGWINKEDCI